MPESAARLEGGAPATPLATPPATARARGSSPLHPSTPPSLIPHPSSLHTAGFTLIELLAVMLIAVLLISLGYAGYSEMRKTTGVGTAARNVADALSLARQAAVTSGHRTRFLMMADVHQYGVVREVPGLRIKGQPYWEAITEVQAGGSGAQPGQKLPLGVGFAGTLPPSNNTAAVMWAGSELVYTNASPATFYTNTIYVAPPYSYSTIEFSREGRPSQTWTVTVARGYYNGSSFLTSGADYAWVIVDGQTGKTRVERK